MTTILVGNLNINWRGNSTPRRMLANSLSTCGLTPLAFSPTQHHRKLHSTIDFICVSDASNVTAHVQQYRPYISEHDALLATLDFALPRLSTRYVNRRSFRYFSVELFQSDLASISRHDLVSAQDIDQKVESFTSTITKLYHFHAPYRSVAVKMGKSSPWFHNKVGKLITEHNKAWQLYKLFKRSEDHATYKRLRNRVKTESQNQKSTRR